MRRPDISLLPEYFGKYINLLEDIDLMEAFGQSILEIDAVDIELSESIGDKVYEPGKWTIKEIIQHITDGERVMAFRAFLFARKDPRMQLEVDFDKLHTHSNGKGRTIESLLHQLKITRLSTIEMFRGFDKEALLNTGINWKYEMSVLAMGFFLIGHQTHHFNIIREKYLNL